MLDYRHNRVPGPSFFFTVRLLRPDSVLLTDYVAAFGEAVRHVRARRPFHVDAWVVLPDHAHAIWTLPDNDANCTSRWREIKIGFSKQVGKSGTVHGELWTPQFQHLAIRDDAHYCELVDYIHDNPVRHGLVDSGDAWQWSSLHRFNASRPASDVLASNPSPTSAEPRP